MENPRAEKVAVVDEVRERFGQANAAILTEYRGLKVKDLATLRRALTAAGGEYRIYKNTLVRFAARDLGLQDLEDLLVGPTAIAFVDGDAAAVAKALRDYARTNPALVVKGGVLGNRVVDAAAAAALADLPSREVLLSRIAGGLAAPMQQFAGLLQALPRNFAYGLKALVEKGGGVPAADEPEPAAAAAEAPEPEAPVAETPVAEAPAAEAAEAPAAEAPAAEAPAAEVVADATATDDTAAASPSETETDTTTPAEAAPSAETQE